MMKKTVALVLALLLIGAAALADYAVYAIADPTYLRSGPGISGERLTNLRPDSAYEWGGNISVDERGVAWFDVFFGNKYGWVSSLHADLCDRQTGALQNYVNYPLPDDCTLFARRDLDVYSDAGTNSYYIGTLYKGESAIFTGFRKKDSKGREWCQIRFYSERGWVPSENAEIY